MVKSPPGTPDMGFLFVFSLVGIVLCVCVLLWGMGSSPKQMLDAWIRQLQQALQAHQNAAGLRQGGLPRELDGTSSDEEDSEQDGVHAEESDDDSDDDDGAGGAIRRRGTARNHEHVARKRRERQARREAREAQRAAVKARAAAAAEARQRRAEEAESALAARGVDVTGDTLWKQKVQEAEAARAASGADEAARRARMLDVLSRAPGRAALLLGLRRTGPVALARVAAACSVHDDDVLDVLEAMRREGVAAVVVSADGTVQCVADEVLDAIAAAVRERGALTADAAAGIANTAAEAVDHSVQESVLEGLAAEILEAGGAR